VTRLVRRSPGAGEVQWQPDAGSIDVAALEGIDAVVHLAGENIAGARWTPERKRALRESRVGPTALLASALARLARKPRVLVSVSATGFYGSRGSEVLLDESGPGTDFLAGLAREWEDAAAPAEAAGIRVAHPRFGIVLSPAGGALAKMLPPFLAGAGGPMGGGEQWMSWSSIDDAIGMLHFAIASQASGAFNAVASQESEQAGVGVATINLCRRFEMKHNPAFARGARPNMNRRWPATEHWEVARDDRACNRRWMIRQHCRFASGQQENTCYTEPRLHL
jgi:hypothetical protein